MLEKINNLNQAQKDKLMYFIRDRYTSFKHVEFKDLIEVIKLITSEEFISDIELLMSR